MKTRTILSLFAALALLAFSASDANAGTLIAMRFFTWEPRK